MKKTIITLSLMAITSLWASDTMRSELSLTAGYNKFDSASKLENATLFGIRGSIYENEINRYGLQLGYEGTSGISYENTYPVKETDLHRFFTRLVIDGEEELSVTPYLFLGGGYELLSDEIEGEPSQGFIDLGVGFKYNFDNNFNLALETRGIGKFETRDLDFNVNLALGYVLGNIYAQKRAPLIALEDTTKEPKLKKSASTEIDIVEVEAPKETTMTIVEERQLSPLLTDRDEVAPLVKDEVVDDSAIIMEDAYYIQVAAYRSTPTEPLMQRLQERGFDNAFVYPSNEINRVLVGPFITKLEAKETIGALKAIRNDAFITKIK
jgi:opacity protein-like surface antigen